MSSRNPILFRQAQAHEQSGEYDLAIECLRVIAKNCQGERDAMLRMKYPTDEQLNEIQKRNDLIGTIIGKMSELKSKPVLEKKPVLDRSVPHDSQNASNTSTASSTESFNLDQYLVTDISETFDDIVGMDRLKEITMTMIGTPLIQPDLFTINKPSKGLVLYGAPGTGKTFFTRCLVGELNQRIPNHRVSLLNVKLSEIFNKFVGETEKIISSLFRLARGHRPCILFFDEADALFDRRTNNDSDVSKRAKTEFLMQMAGMDNNRGLFFISATNFPENIDDAFMRRLGDDILEIPLPDLETRMQMIVRHFKRNYVEFGEDDITSMAKDTENYSCDDMQRWLNSANNYRLELIQKARYFRPLDVDVRRVYVPCEETDDDAIELNFMDLPENSICDNTIPIPAVYYREKLAVFRPFTTQQTLDRLAAFARRHQ